MNRWPEVRNEVRTSIEFESIFWQILMEYRDTEFGFAPSAKAFS